MQLRWYLISFSIIHFLACSDQFLSQVSDSPNIIIILVDDLGFGDLSLAGNVRLKTPHLDQLAKKSVHFTNFYVSSVCAPTRASLLTGRYHQRTGVQSVTNGHEIIDPNENTLAEILKDQDYQTGIFGKWHLGEYYPSLPVAQGFDQFIGFRTGHVDNYFDAVLEKNGQPWHTHGYITEVLTREAWSFIKNRKTQPFFCYLAYNAPHTPLQIDSSWFTAHLADTNSDERTARVYGLIENLDYHIGQLMDSLTEAQLLNNTMVIFMSDNGPISGWQIAQEKMRYNAGLRDQKFTTYEGGIRTHCFWYWQDHWQPALKAEIIAAHIDVVPTIMDILNITPDTLRPMDGTSLKRVLEGDQDQNENRLFFQKYALGTFDSDESQPGGMVRKGAWKMIHGNQLFNLTQDPGEKTNLATLHPEILLALNRDYENWWHSIRSDLRLRPPAIRVGNFMGEMIHLQPHHGHVTGGLQFEGKRGLTAEHIGTHPTGVDGDWLSHWRTQTDTITWQLEVQKEGYYACGIELTISALELSPTLKVSSKEDQVETTLMINGGHPDWTFYALGEIFLKQGLNTISLNSVDALPANDLCIRSLVLSLK